MIAYLLASIALTIVYFEAGGGHADVPFTTFPDYFVVAPVLPVLVLADLGRVRGTDVLSLAAFVVTLVAVWVVTGALIARTARSAATFSSNESEDHP
ncbi:MULTISPECIES: hypothetical protein [unclassified Anaeromyxobacter]|uniref:hypothetical protein n=1 Tax=unclassified Anaeromyxobacter TaxID=2620896 RepID=UPI001F565C62|nr:MULTISPECIES: hypothetical protein [unclassified Anaeromyxobacter]